MKHILIVEDEDEIRLMISRGLQKRGYQITNASDSESAMKNILTLNGKFDVVVTDIKMPGISGKMWLDFLKRFIEPEGTKIVVITSLPSATPEEVPFKMLEKPVIMDDLVNLIDDRIKRE